MNKLCAAVIWGLILAPVQGLAADLDALRGEPASGQPLVEIGSGWYIRGDVGASLDSTPTLSFDPASLSAPPPASVSPTNGPITNRTALDTSIGVGYRFNSYFRADATFDYHTGTVANRSASGIVCPYTATGLTSQSALSASGGPLELGYAYNANDTCNAGLQLNQTNYTSLANGYLDLFSLWGVTPYVGAGAGVNLQRTSGSLAYTKASDGTPYRADLSQTGTFPLVWVNPVTGAPISPQPKIAFAQQNWDRTLKSSKYSLAIALTAGVGISLTPNATIDLSYRYLNLGSSSYVVNAQTGSTISQRNAMQEVRVGLRYAPD